MNIELLTITDYYPKHKGGCYDPSTMKCESIILKCHFIVDVMIPLQ